MSGSNMRKASLAEIEQMKSRGELFEDPKARAGAPEGEELGPDFWAKAIVEGPKRKRSVHLKLEPEVFDFFSRQSGGKGHLTKMQNVLKAYVEAHRNS